MKKRRGFGMGMLFFASTLAGCGAGEKGERGEKGEAGSSTDANTQAAISQLDPPELFAGRSVLVQIAGDGTHFTGGSSVEFSDPAIKVRDVVASSSANLRLMVDVGVDARMGPHDVKVTSQKSPAGGDEEALVLKSGFTVLPSLIAELPMGTTTPSAVPQGGIVSIAMRSIDELQNPFNPMLGQGPVVAFGPLPLDTPQVSTLRYGYLGLVDALAPAAGLPVGVTQPDRLGRMLGYASSPDDKNAPQVTARAATVLSSGVVKNGELLWPATSGTRATQLYKLTTAADNQVAHLLFSALGPTLSTTVVSPRGISLVGHLAAANGRFRDGVGIESSETPGMVADSVTSRSALLLLPKAGDYYFTIHASDFSSNTSHSYSLTARWTTAASIGSLKEPEPPSPPESPTNPLANIASLDRPYFATDGMADKGFDDDFIRFKAAKTGRVYVTVLTTPGVSMGLGIRAADCISTVATTRYSVSGTVANESDAAAGTAYCVRIVGNAQPAPYQIFLSQSLD